MGIVCSHYGNSYVPSLGTTCFPYGNKLFPLSLLLWNYLITNALILIEFHFCPYLLPKICFGDGWVTAQKGSRHHLKLYKSAAYLPRWRLKPFLYLLLMHVCMLLTHVNKLYSFCLYSQNGYSSVLSSSQSLLGDRQSTAFGFQVSGYKYLFCLFPKPTNRILYIIYNI